jgi:hypothetical protein
MFIGMGMPIPDLSNLPGPSRPGGGGGGAFEYTAIDNSFSMKFDAASSSHYVIPGDTFTASSSGFSICFWYYKTAQQVGQIISKGAHNFEIYTHTNGNALWTYFGSASDNTNKIPVVLNSWQHICYVVSSTGYKGYQNGVPTVENTFSSAPNYASPLNTIYLAARSGYQQNSDITLDEVAFFNSELSDTTIQAIYDATANNPGKVADLSETPEGIPAAWYRMGD